MGGTALHKLFFNSAGRFSEDLDFVQRDNGPIGELVDAIRGCLDYWLGEPRTKRNHGRFTLFYQFETEIEPIVTRKIKIEINTREHFNVDPYNYEIYSVENNWFSGECRVLTYSLAELLATKLRALYQRKKGRDLYDFWFVSDENIDVNIKSIIEIFKQYMKLGGEAVSRAEFEMNLYRKKNDKVFNSDISELLSADQDERYQPEEAYHILFNQFLNKLPGGGWKGLLA